MCVYDFDSVVQWPQRLSDLKDFQLANKDNWEDYKDSLVLRAKGRDGKMFYCKVFPRPMEGMTDFDRRCHSFIAEFRLYMKMTQLVDKKITPHVVRGKLIREEISAEEFAGSVPRADGLPALGVSDVTSLFPKNYPDGHNVTVMATEGVDEGYRVCDYKSFMVSFLMQSPMPCMGNHTPTEAEARAIFTQLLFTLECFAQLGIQHVDLHPGNMLCVDLGKVQAFNYHVSCGGVDFTFQIKTRFILRVFDFDLGCKFPTKYDADRIENLYTSYTDDKVSAFNSSSRPMAGFDFFKVYMCVQAVRHGSSSMGKVVREWVKTRVADAMWEMRGKKDDYYNPDQSVFTDKDHEKCRKLLQIALINIAREYETADISSREDCVWRTPEANHLREASHKRWRDDDGIEEDVEPPKQIIRHK